MNKTQMQTLVSAAINRGTSFDSFVPGALRQAVNLIEQNNNFRYMHYIRSFQKDPAGTATQQSPKIELGADLTKRIEFVRTVLPGTDGSIQYGELRQTELDNLIALPAGQMPTAWYDTFDQGVVAGDRQLLIVLNVQSFPTAFTVDVDGYWYTDYDQYDATKSHWLLTRGEMVVLAQAMINLAPIIRQAESIPVWEALFAKNMKTLLIADDEMAGGGQVESINPPED